MKNGERIGIEGDPPIGVRLRVLLEEPTFNLDDGALDRERPDFEVDVAPTKGAKFTAASAGGGRDVNEAREFGVHVIRRAQQLTDLNKIGRGEVALGESGWGGVCGRVRSNPTPENGLAECPSNDGVGLTNRRRRQSDSPYEALIEIVKLHGLNAADWSIANGRKNSLR